MNKQWVDWKLVICKSEAGKYYHAGIPQIIDRKNRGTLLAKIIAMPKQKPISFDDAIRMVKQVYFEAEIGHKPGQCTWFFANFVEWITSQGFHIELTGDEFEETYGPQRSI